MRLRPTPLPQDMKFKAALAKVLDEVSSSTHLTEGRFVRELEQIVYTMTGLHAVAVSNCGAGLFAVMRQYTAGRAVVPTNTFYATGAMAKEAHFGVKLADSAPNQFSCGLQQIREAVSNETTMVVLTHVGGWLAPEYQEISEYCQKRAIVLIEDAAHTLGVGFGDGRAVTAGDFGNAAVYSLYPTKAVPVGEGGIVVTHDETLAKEVRQFVNYGKKFANGVIEYRPGFNLRMDEWSAAVACLQLKRMDEILERRREDAARLAKIIPLWEGIKPEETNFYKYPALASDAAALGIKRFAGKIYQASDQLTKALFHDDTPMRNAGKLADEHVCIPLGEGLYDNLKDRDILDWLRMIDG